MPRILAVRVGRLPIWLAFTLDDYEQTGRPRLGLSADHAIKRCLRTRP